MSAHETLRRQLILISKLRIRPRSFEEIESILELESEITGYNLQVSQRTFQRDIQQIASLYNIEIKNDRSRNVYEIVYDGADAYKDRMMESFEMFNALNLSSSMEQHIIPELRKPSGTEHLHGLLHAIKNKVEIQFTHEKYWEGHDAPTVRSVQPLAIKEARYRWYLIAKDHKDGIIKTFGLDRITNLEITPTGFTPPEGYSPEKAFQYCFGVVGDASKPERVVLSFTVEQGKYVKSLPLHSSQKELIINEKEYRVELYVHPTYDFVMELMSLGNQVKVLEPESLRSQLLSKLEDALAGYK
jgi:proteasome accessory factor B